MDEKNCKSLLSSLSDYVDGSAQAEICRRLEDHLEDCDDCRIVVDTLKKTITLYHSETTTSLPGDVRERLFQRLDLDDFLPNS